MAVDVTEPAGDPGPGGWRGGRRWLGVLVALWAVVIGVTAYLSAHDGKPTAREQTSVASARPIVERAVTDTVSAAGTDAVVAVAPFSKVETCRISVARDGESWEQVVRVYTRPGTERALVDRLARELPGSYQAFARPDGQLRARAENYVDVSGGPAGTGEVRLTVSTGCRTGTGTGSAGFEPAGAERAPVAAALSALRVEPARWSGFRVPCQGGGAVRVVVAESQPGTVPSPLPAALATVGPGPVVADAEVYAYRTTDGWVVASARDGMVRVSASTPCTF